jgi:cyclopropane fatty-acyl-phospholipid synthase-like methyltransferase
VPGDPAWYEKWFGEDYLAVYGHRDNTDAAVQAELIARTLPLEPGMHLLDLCCGDGRHARIFHDMGYAVTGIDLSAVLIERARTCGPDDIEFEVADMRHFGYTDRFDVCVNLFTSFGYFHEHTENVRALEAVYNALHTDGCFWLDFMNSERVKSTLEPFSRRELPAGMVVEERRTIDEDEKRIEKHIVITREWESHEYHESVRMYDRAELEDMLTSVGFAVTHAFGDYHGAEASGDAPRLILVGQKG